MSVRAHNWWRIGLLAVAFLFLGWLFVAARAALTPFIIGIIIALLLLPLIDRLDKRMPRAVAVGLVYLIFFGVLIGLGFWLVPILVDQTTGLLRNAPNYFSTIQKWLTNESAALRKQIPEQFQQPLDDFLNNFGSNATTTLRNYLGGFVTGTLSYTFGIVGAVIGFVIVPFWVFYVVSDKDKALKLVDSLSAPPLRADIRRLLSIVYYDFLSYVGGQLLLGLAVGICYAIGLTLIGFPIATAIFLGVIGGCGELVPIIGPIIGGIPAVLVGFFQGGAGNIQLAGLAILVMFVVQQLENAVLVPKIAGNSTNIHPAFVILLVIVGSEVAGIPGAIGAVPIAAIIRDVYVYAYQRLVVGVSVEDATQIAPGGRGLMQKRAKEASKGGKSAAPADGAAPTGRRG